MSSIYGSVQRQDWNDRDFIEIISRNIKKISDFLNHFDQSCRGKLAELNEKLTHLERQIEFLEAATTQTTNSMDQSHGMSAR